MRFDVPAKDKSVLGEEADGEIGGVSRTRLFFGAGDNGRLQPSGGEVVATHRVVDARGRGITREQS